MKLEQINFESPAEKVHLRLLRIILGVSNKTSCSIVSGELGEYLTDMFVFSQMT